MLKKFWQSNKGLIIGLFALLFFRTAVADWYKVPSGSMQPNILIGDRVFVNKLAYDIKIPFTDINFSRRSDPRVGDIIVFSSQRANERLIKRVIAVPGDSVAMHNNHLFVNQVPVELEPIVEEQDFDVFLNDRINAAYYVESRALNHTSNNEPQLIELQNEHKSQYEVKEQSNNKESVKTYPIRVSRQYFSQLASFETRIVGKDEFWVMGDNRDNSSDSRVIGMVPREELIGRAERVVVSLDADNYYLPRAGRFWEAL